MASPWGVRFYPNVAYDDRRAVCSHAGGTEERRLITSTLLNRFVMPALHLRFGKRRD